MASPTPLENRLLAKERKKLLTERLLAMGKKQKLSTPAAINDEKQTQLADLGAQVAPPQETSAKSISQVRFGKAQIPFFSPEHPEALQVSSALATLVNLYIEAAEQRNAHVALTWPGGLTCLPLVHSLATLERWSQGYKRGVRGLFYPAKQTTFHPLNHIFVGRTRLLEIANDVYEDLSKPNPKIRESCKGKDLMIFALGSLRKEAQEANLRPCLNELLPYFYMAHGDAIGWKSYEDDFLEHFLTKLSRRSHKVSLKNDLSTLGNPKTAPDALFALSYRLGKQDLRDALKELKRVGAPEVLLLDGTRPTARLLENWRSRFVNFLGLVEEVFGDQRPGVVVVTDDPRQMVLLKHLLSKHYESLGHAVKHKIYLKPHAVARLSLDRGIQAVPEAALEETEPRQLRVEVTDADAAKTIQGFYGAAERIQAAGGQPKQIRAAANFLQALSSLPSSVNVLYRWLDERAADEHMRKRFDWMHYRSQVTIFIEEGNAADARGDLERLLKTADAIVEAYRRHTPLALKLAQEVNKCVGGDERIGVVIPRPLYETLATRFLEEYDGYAEGVSFSQLGSRVRFVLPVSMDAFLAEGWATRLVFSSLTSDALRHLVSDNRIPPESVLILTRRNALFVKHSLAPLMAMPEFGIFQKRIAEVLQPLESLIQADDKAILSVDDIDTPTFALAVNEPDNEGGFDEKEAVYITLDTKQVLRRGRGSILYVYEPSGEKVGYTGFHGVHAENLNAGQLVFVMAEELRELVEEFLNRAGIRISSDAKFENFLREYHRQITERLNRYFEGSRTAQVRLLREKMEHRHPELDDSFTNLRHWVDLGESHDTPFDQLTPQAPRSFKHFQALGQALEFSDTEISFFWLTVIQPLRGRRRVDGRRLSDIYTRVLFDQESAIAYQKLSRATTSLLYEKALENVHAVVEVKLPN